MHRSNSQWVRGRRVRARTMELSEENLKVSLCGLGQTTVSRIRRQEHQRRKGKKASGAALRFGASALRAEGGAAARRTGEGCLHIAQLTRNLRPECVKNSDSPKTKQCNEKLIVHFKNRAKALTRYFSKKEMQKANKHLKRCSSPPGIREGRSGPPRNTT